MAKYDIEMLCSDIKSMMVTNLSTKIDSLNTEKNDSITLGHIETNAYFFQSMNDRIANYDRFIFYGIEEINTISQRGNSSDEVSISMMVIMPDNGQDSVITTRLLRYQRAMKEVIQENFTLTANAVNLEIKNIVPIDFKDENTNMPYKAVGITIRAVLA